MQLKIQALFIFSMFNGLLEVQIKSLLLNLSDGLI